MRALTLKPHWAHAIAHMGKRIENRSRPPARTAIGTRIAIHAGARLPKRWDDELDTQLGHCAYLTEHDITTRAIIATAYLAGYEHGHDDPPPWGIRGTPYWWRLTDVRVLIRPVYVERGQLGLWRLTTEQEQEVQDAE